MSAYLLILIFGASGLGAAVFWWRRRGLRRVPTARALCGLLDRYLDGLALQQAERFDSDALWNTLEQARALQREHFPELYVEMMELSGAHRVLTELLLQGHMERHGAPTNWSALEAPAQLAAAHARVDAAVRVLQARSRELAGIHGNGERPHG